MRRTSECGHDPLPSAPGLYALILESRRLRAARIGRLGTMRIEPGFYVYVGSAFGPGGLRARLTHHARRAKHPHWHIDYLRLRASPDHLWLSTGGDEHQWAAAVASLPGACTPIRGFGSSGCRCPSHLFFFPRRPALAAFRRTLRRFDAAQPPVRAIRLRAR